MCAGIGFWATLAFLRHLLFTEIAAGGALLAQTVLPLAAALLGFLFFNFNPATVFLGDSGAMLIGFLIGCFGIVWAGNRVTATSMALPLLALCVPMMDLGLSIIRRRLRNRPIFSADKGHIHHQLVARGLTVRRVAVVLYAQVGIRWGDFHGLLISFPGSHVVFSAIVAAGAIAAALAGIRELRYAEFEGVGRLLFRGE